MQNSESVIKLTHPTDLLALTRHLKYEAYLLPLFTAFIILADISIAIGSFVLAYWWRQEDAAFFRPQGAFLPVDITWNFRPYFSLLTFVPLVRIWTLRHYDLYRLKGEFSLLQDWQSLFKATLVGSLVISSIAFLYRGGVEYRDFSYSRLVFIYDLLFSFAAYTLLRLAVRFCQTLYRQNSGNLIPALVVGCGHNAEVCISEIAEKPRLGYRVVGVLSVENDQNSFVAGLPVLGSFSDLPSLVRQYGIKEVLITDDRISPQTIFESIMNCGRKHAVEFRVFPNLFNCLPRKTEIDQIGSLPMIKLFAEPLQGPNRLLKRGMDIAFSLTGLILSFPLWLLIIIAIKLNSRGPAIYQQERVGMDGRVFRMYKFRSMYVDTVDLEHRELMRQNINNGERANQGDGEIPIYGKLKDDNRVTKVGAIIRRYSLDELPQLLNVILGEMSLVGPRPPIPYEVECYHDWHRARFHVKPGLTGLWQVSGRNRLNFEQMVRLDIYYIENWSFWLDLKILLKTIPVALRGDNAY
ncbi:MAG: sugar transferase [Acidobacteria bacterium]|nr:sugar transferase [Acidobacteriota bacterium]